MDESIHELVDLYALSALEADESAAFEAHLAACGQCQEALAATNELLGELDRDIAIAPPESLRAQVLGEIENMPQEVVESPAEQPLEAPIIDLSERRAQRFSPAWLTSVAAALVLVVVGAAAFLSFRPSASFDSVAQASDAVTVDLAGEVDGSVTVAWSESEGQLAVVASDLDALPEDKTYELWFFEGDQPVPAGIFVPDEDGVVEFVGDFAGDPSLWAITVEQAGGVDVPTTTPIFVGEL